MPNLPTRNANPGDLKNPETGGFKQFSSPQEGYAALLNDLSAKMTGTTTTGLSPSSSLAEFAKVYAPPGDSNNSAKYAADLANQLGVSPATQIGTLRNRLGEFADAVAKNEGFQGAPSLQKSPNIQQGNQNAPEQSFLGQVSGDISNSLGGAGQALSSAAQGKINPASGLLQGVGSLASGVGSVTNDVLGLIPGVKQAEGLLGQGVGALAQSAPGQAAIQSYQTLPEEWRGNIGAIANIASLVPMFKGLGIAKDVAGSAVTHALGKDVLANTIEDVTPQLGAKTLAKNAANRGLVKTALTGKILPVVGASERKIAEAVAQFVPGFDRLGTFTDKINATRDAAYKMADELKQAVEASGSDRIYSFRELGATLRSVERPLLIASDTTLNNAYDRVISKAIEIAKANGGTISSLFDARKELDQFIEQQFPNLYSSDTLTPMRSAVKGIRKSMNSFIDERLPTGSGFRDSLRSQNLLFTAIDNMAPKAVKEIGTTRLGRLGARHPIISGLLRNIPGNIETGLGINLTGGLFK